MLKFGIKIKNKVKSIQSRLLDVNDLFKCWVVSRHILRTIIEKTETTNTAVVVHLYYADSWRTIESRLTRLDNFDLIVTIPRSNKYIIPKIQQKFKNAQVIIVPNRGRDVLSFLLLLPKIKEAGYKNVLKIHSKKSIHRTDGNKWLNDMLDKLIPEDEVTANSIYKALGSKESSIVGPSEHFVSLKVNFKENKHYTMLLLRRLYDKDTVAKILKNPEKYGFFAGTMFWARIESLCTIISSNIKISDFDREHGQIDSTLAHAYERLFCLVPEIESRSIFQTGSDLVKLDYSSGTIPDWSDVEVKK
jgi:lipopolysaccharide biosynthesis protein